MKFLPPLFFIFCYCNVFPQTTKDYYLHRNWVFKKEHEEKWLPATVPGTVHTDLLKNKIISDPVIGNNEKDVQWIENENWQYKTEFQLFKSDFSYKHIELVCEGLDTYANVYVNGKLVITAENMFRLWSAELKGILKEGNNSVLIEFTSSVKKGKELAAQLPFTLPGDEKVFTRKAQYQYGWDWGPRLVTCGIWKNIKLHYWNNVQITSFHYNQKSLTDSLAELEFVTEIESDNNSTVDLKIKCDEMLNVKPFTTKVEVHKGINIIKTNYTIPNPTRWWCNGLGKPFLYSFKFSLENNNQLIDKKEMQIGLRTIELVQDTDSAGKSFYFKLNGIPVFMKGANYIPPGNFLPLVTNEKYKELIQSAVDAHMNMLRVWGGGVYPDDEYYDQCDKNGILIWQDFMFACAMYPGDDKFLENVRGEVAYQTQRLRNHPCIALWCGNNEIDEGWKNWGWQQQYKYSASDSAKIWNDYLNVFNKLIPSVLDSSGINNNIYWPSSPSIGWGHKESLTQGDSHYWGVWWGMEPFENYKIKVGRFMSEYGFQGMPGNAVLKNIFENDPWSLQSEKLKSHQKHPTGFATIDEYMQRDYRKPKDFASYAYVSQLLQAEGMQTAIEAHRRAKPYCMGTLYWQLNDCWNAVSWSSIAYSGVWKAQHYMAKKSYATVLISATEENEKLNVYVVNDNLKNINATLSLRLMDFKGNVLWKDSAIVSIDLNSGKIYFSIEKKDFEKYKKNEILLSMEVLTSNGILADNIYYFSKPKDLQLSKPNLKYKIAANNSIEISTDVLAKNVNISIEGNNLNYSDNYFDLLPNSIKTISLNTKGKFDLAKSKIKLLTLFDTF